MPHRVSGVQVSASRASIRAFQRLRPAAVLAAPLAFLIALAAAGRSSPRATATDPRATAGSPLVPTQPPAGQESSGGPELIANETQGAARQAWPLALGVPFPPGWLPEGAFLEVAADGGTSAAQVGSLAHWPDGSVRWARVDFQASIKPRGRLRLRLQRGRARQPETSVRVTEKKDSIEVDTGAMRFGISKRSFEILQALAVSGKPLPAGPVRAFIETGGEHLTAQPPASVTVDDRGPLRAQITVRGSYGAGIEYVLRLEAFAGKPFLRLRHTFINAGDRPYTKVNRIALELPAKVGGHATYYAAVKRQGAKSGPLRSTGTYVTQTDGESFYTGSRRHSGRLAGWFELRGESAAIGLDVPFFWQEYPQAVRFEAGRLTYELWPAVEARPAKIGLGTAKTHEFLLAFATRQQGQRAVVLTAWPGRGVNVHTDPAWIAASGALPNAITPGHHNRLLARGAAAFRRFVKSTDTERWDDAGEVQCPPEQTEKPRQGFYGMFNWGDWNLPGYHDTTKGCDAWGNEEYDLTQALALLFAGTGDADVFTYLVAAARHYADVDVIHHFPPAPEWVGMNHPKNPLHFTFELGGVEPGHTWVEGLFSYYFLPGEKSALAAALGIADYLRTRQPLERKGNPRQFGWPALALAAEFDATGDRRYRDAALDYARRGMELYPAAGGAKHWKRGILADGVAYVHASTGDPRCRRWLMEYADAVIARRPADIRHYPAVAYVAHLTGESRYRRAAQRALQRVKLGSWGTALALCIRTACRITALLDRPPPHGSG